MATKAQIQRLLEAGDSYESAARRLGIPAGLAFMIATGLPADGSDASAPEDLVGRPSMPASPQRLVNPPAVSPTGNEAVLAWVSERAARELTRR